IAAGVSARRPTAAGHPDAEPARLRPRPDGRRPTRRGRARQRGRDGGSLTPLAPVSARHPRAIAASPSRNGMERQRIWSLRQARPAICASVARVERKRANEISNPNWRHVLHAGSRGWHWNGAGPRRTSRPDSGQPERVEGDLATIRSSDDPEVFGRAQRLDSGGDRLGDLALPRLRVKWWSSAL